MRRSARCRSSFLRNRKNKKKEDAKEETSSAVNTGDSAMLGTWGLTFVLSGVTLVANRKRKKE